MSLINQMFLKSSPLIIFVILIGLALLGAGFYVAVWGGTIPFFQEKRESTAQRVLPQPTETTTEEATSAIAVSEPEPEPESAPTPQAPGVLPIPTPSPLAETQPTPQVETPPVPQESPSEEKPQSTPKEFIVFIDAGGFNPRFITITVGDRVQWFNADTALHWPASDPHPTHTGLSDFDPFADLRPGESFGFIFQTTGIFAYHDHTQAVVDDLATITGVVQVCSKIRKEDPERCEEP